MDRISIIVVLLWYSTSDRHLCHSHFLLKIQRCEIVAGVTNRNFPFENRNLRVELTKKNRADRINNSDSDVTLGPASKREIFNY